MSNATRIALLLLLVALAAGGYWFYGQSTGGSIAPQTPAETPQKPAARPDPTPAPTNAATAGPIAEQPQEPTRVAALPAGNTLDDAPQGVKGRVLLPDGTPAAQIPIFLIESMMNDVIGAFLAQKSGKPILPVSFGYTADNGTFALGTRKPDSNYDLRIASANHPEHDHNGVKVRSDEWVDVGDIRLDNGLVVAGRVLDEVQKTGVANATVYLADSNQAHSMLPTPGRERGIVAVTDASGAFRFANAPTVGTVNLVAEAQGYASTTLPNQTLKEDNPLDVTIEIARGQPIAGVVVDQNGNPLANVQVTAQGLSQKTPQNATTSTAANGTFEFACLREGPYQLTTLSPAHVDGKAPPAMTGDLDVKLVLVERPWVKLKVLSPGGQPVTAYRISLKRHFPNNAVGIGNVPEFADRSVTPADYGGTPWAKVRGLPPGTFVFQIQDKDHAKSLSEPFTVVEGGEPVEVTATLTDGATITGLVLDDQGKPVRGATITTDMNGAFQGEGGLFDLFKAMIPEKHSKAQAKTDGEGRFRLSRLAFADYMVRISHDDYCEGTALDIHLDTPGQVYDAGTIQLARGCVIEGFATLDGLAQGQIKVQIQTATAGSTAMPLEQRSAPPPPNPATKLFSLSGISDNDGRYRLLKRVPPGDYKIHASRASGEQNPFMVLLDMRATERAITIAPGQDRLQLDFNLTSR